MQGSGSASEHLQRAAPIISGFLLGYVAVLPLIGRLADLVDRQRVLLGCLAIFVAGSSSRRWRVELPVLVAGRVVQGIGGGGLVPATLAIVAALWPEERRGLPLGVVGAVGNSVRCWGPSSARSSSRSPTGGRSSGSTRSVVSSSPSLIARAGGGVRWRVHGIRLGVSVLAALVLGLALWAPAPVTDSVTLGVPFVPFGTMTSPGHPGRGRRARPRGARAGVGRSGRSWPVLREAHPVGAALLGGMLGCIVLTFASPTRRRRSSGRSGSRCSPLGIVPGSAVVHRRSPTPVIRGAWSVQPDDLGPRRRSWSGSPWCCRRRHPAPLPASSTTATRHPVGRDRERWSSSASSSPLPGRLLGRWVLQWAGDGLVAALGLVGAAAGLAILSTYGRDSFSASRRMPCSPSPGIGSRPGSGEQRRAHPRHRRLRTGRRARSSSPGWSGWSSGSRCSRPSGTATTRSSRRCRTRRTRPHFRGRGDLPGALRLPRGDGGGRDRSPRRPLLGLRRHAPVGGRRTFGL